MLPTISISQTGSWVTGADTIFQYQITILNSTLDTLTTVNVKSSNTAVSNSWSCSRTNNVFGFPSWMKELAPTKSFAFGVEVKGTSTFVVDSVAVKSTTSTPIPTSSNTITTSNTPTPSSSNITSTSTPVLLSSNLDVFGVQMLYPSSVTSPRIWNNNWNKGPLRTLGFGAAGPYDPELIFRGSGTYTIYGQSNDRSGQMRVTGSTPRIYIRGSTVESAVLPSNVPKWNNVEITFYANTTDAGANVSYAGIQAECRTNHCPDSDLCSTRGYGAKMNFDGRAHFEKECCHGRTDMQTKYLYPWGGKMPLNTWIGLKFVSRACENNTKCKQEMWLDMTDGLNGGDWKLVSEFTDYDGWSSSSTCCELHRGKVLLPPHMTANYSIYLRTDGLGEQFYKKLSIREVDPLP